MTTCPVCIEKYTKEIRAKVTCPYCPMNACRGCVQRYLTTTYDDPHCMECRRGWNREFLDLHLTKVFRNGTLRKHRAKVLMEREKAMLPAMQVFVEAKKNIESTQKHMLAISKKLQELQDKRQKIIFERNTVLRKYRANPAMDKKALTEEVEKNIMVYGRNEAELAILNIDHEHVLNANLRAKNIYEGRDQNATREEAREFIQRCPADGCRGYLSTAYKCGTCSKYTCNECLVVKGDSKDAEHTCNEDAKASAALIRRETKPCPKCGVRIYKIDGCFAKNTPILLWNGHYKNSQDVKVGDVLIGDDGEPRVVEELCSGGDEMYEVSQGKGMNYIVNSKHKLALKFSGEKSIHWSESENAWKVRWFDREEHLMKTKKIKVDENTNKDEAFTILSKFCETLNFDEVIEITIDDYMKLSEATKEHFMGFKSSCVNWPQKDVMIDPYLFGLWLGDGINDGMSFAINPEADPEILHYILDWCEKNKAELIHDEAYRFRIRRREVAFGRLAIGRGATSSECKGCKEKKCTLCDLPNKLYTEEVEVGLRHPLKELLDKYELPRKSKYIPTEYLTNSREVRLQLLAGLIDTDGYLGNGGKRIQIPQANHNLGKQIEYLARSLGFAVHTDIVKKTNISFPNNNPKDYGDQYRVNISGDNLSDIPTRVARKRCVNSNSTKDELRTGITVKSVGQGTYYGWSVSGTNKRFLLGDFTVVRNCDQMWCTQDGCHTAFSWKTGHIVTGVVHNPHYYEWLRRQNNGAAPRENTDIPCGGLPLAWTFTSLIHRNVTGIRISEKNLILAIHRCLGDVINARLPDYPARRPANMNKEINVAYLMNQVNDEEWQKALEQTETKFERKKEIGQILNTFANVGSEFMRMIERAGTSEAIKTLWLNQLRTQCDDLRLYTNQSLTELGKRMMCAVPQFTNRWEYIPPRKDPYVECYDETPNPYTPGTNQHRYFEDQRIAIVKPEDKIVTNAPKVGFPVPANEASVQQQPQPQPQPQQRVINPDDFVDDRLVVVE